MMGGNVCETSRFAWGCEHKRCMQTEDIPILTQWVMHNKNKKKLQEI